MEASEERGSGGGLASCCVDAAGVEFILDMADGVGGGGVTPEGGPVVKSPALSICCIMAAAAALLLAAAAAAVDIDPCARL